eukprot:187177-Chlamydomonas_euryale.AAC.3
MKLGWAEGVARKVEKIGARKVEKGGARNVEKGGARSVEKGGARSVEKGGAKKELRSVGVGWGRMGWLWGGRGRGGGKHVEGWV